MTFFIFFVYDCNPNNDDILERHIFSSLFNELVDSTITDYRKLVVPSPEDFKNLEGQKKFYELIEMKKTEVYEPLVVFICDTINQIKGDEHVFNKIKPFLEKNDFESILSEIKNKKGKSYMESKLFKMDTTKYKLLSFSDKGEEKYKNRNDLATYNLSRIYFNKSKNIGIFSLDIVYSGLNGYGFIVILDKKDNIWTVGKLVEYWES
ncbi:MAG: hypothetical protein NWQ07_00840 [Flaviramulus sp.]|nr:hypothetical protein [Flaviramulus sp.]